MEQVAVAVENRVADEEGFLALRTVQPDRAAVPVAALGEQQGAGPGLEFPVHTDSLLGEGLFNDARGHAVAR